MFSLRLKNKTEISETSHLREISSILRFEHFKLLSNNHFPWNSKKKKKSQKFGMFEKTYTLFESAILALLLIDILYNQPLFKDPQNKSVCIWYHLPHRQRYSEVPQDSRIEKEKAQTYLSVCEVQFCLAPASEAHHSVLVILLCWLSMKIHQWGKKSSGLLKTFSSTCLT